MTHGSEEDWLVNEDHIDSNSRTPWKILVVDDEESIHQVTQLVLGRFDFLGRNIQLLHARSAKEAQALLQQHPSVALVLLDVIMETDQAGLDLVEYIRDQMGNQKVRILIRTGQAGVGSYTENQLIRAYRFNGFRNKAELSSQELKSAVMSLLRAYDALQSPEAFSKENSLSLQAAQAAAEKKPWKVLVVDDDPQVPRVMELFLSNFQFDNRTVEMLQATSVADAVALLKANPDISLLIVDLILGDPEANGLSLVKTIREEIGNHAAQILIRTGQENTGERHQLIREHPINDFRSKMELPVARLDAILCSMLRTYEDIVSQIKP